LIRGLLDETAAEDIDGMNRGYAKRWIVSGHEIDHSLVGGYFAGMIFLDFGTAGKRFDIKRKIEVVVLLNGCQRGTGALRTLHSKERHTSNDRTIRDWSYGYQREDGGRDYHFPYAWNFSEPTVAQTLFPSQPESGDLRCLSQVWARPHA
jgi:hypothetical protein